MTHTQEEYRKRKQEVIASGGRVMRAALCPSCYGRIPLRGHSKGGWEGVRDCACGEWCDPEDLNTAHGEPPDALTTMPIGLQRRD